VTHFQIFTRRESGWAYASRMTPRLALLAFALVVVSATAQTSSPPSQAPPLDLRLPQPTDAQSLDATVDGDGDLDALAAGGNATTVHGSVTTGIGYSREFGRTSYEGAELNVTHQTDGGHTINLHLDASHGTGVSPYTYPYAGPYPYYEPMIGARATPQHD
jgi:hypothetical protein